MWPVGIKIFYMFTSFYRNRKVHVDLHYAVWTEKLNEWITHSYNEMYLYCICRLWQFYALSLISLQTDDYIISPNLSITLSTVSMYDFLPEFISMLLFYTGKVFPVLATFWLVKPQLDADLCIRVHTVSRLQYHAVKRDK